MKSQTEKQTRDFGYTLDQRPDADRATDTTGLWFAAAVLCAFLTAGVIVYRTGNPNTGDPNIVTAANNVMPAIAKTPPWEPASILPER